MRRRSSGRRRRGVLQAQRRQQALLVLASLAAGCLIVVGLLWRDHILSFLKVSWHSDHMRSVLPSGLVASDSQRMEVVDAMKSEEASVETSGGSEVLQKERQLYQQQQQKQSQQTESDSSSSEGGFKSDEHQGGTGERGEGVGGSVVLATSVEGGSGVGAGGGGGDATAAGLWPKALRTGWEPYSAPVDTAKWPRPHDDESNGYIYVRCNGGLNQQRSAISNAVVVARIMNATLVLPRLDTNVFWNDTSSGFSAIYDVKHFIDTLAPDVRILTKLPNDIRKDKKTRMAKLRPPRDAPPSWYATEALQALRRKRALYLTPFAHRLAEELGSGRVGRELQRLRCRVMFRALRFVPAITRVADIAVRRLRERAGGPFIALHLRFEKDMLAFAGCVDIFTPAQQAELREYRQKNFAEKDLQYTKRRHIGKCPLTPSEVGLVVRSLGFPNSTVIYLASGRVYAEDQFLPPLKQLFPRLISRSAVVTSEVLREVDRHPLKLQAVDFLVCTQADLFIPSYDGPSNFANNVIGHRVYAGFRATVRPDRKALALLVDARAKGEMGDDAFQQAVRNMVYKVPLAGPYPRVNPHHSSSGTAHLHHTVFLANPWPDCFCKQRLPPGEELLGQPPETGGFEPPCPAGYNRTEWLEGV